MRPQVYATSHATKIEIRPLTSIRGIAAMAVVLYHFQGNFSYEFYLHNSTLLFPLMVAVFYRGRLVLLAPVATLAIFGLDWLTSFGPPERIHDFGTNLGWLRCLVEFSTGV